MRILYHCTNRIPLANLLGKYYHPCMRITKKLKEQLRRELNRELASAGGKARAAKYDKKTLSRWAKKGGRPRKDGSR